MATAVNDSYAVASGSAVYVGRIGIPMWRRTLIARNWTSLGTATRHDSLAGTQSNTLNAWGGAVVAGYKYLYTGGGHGDGADNGIFCIDLGQNSPAVARLGIRSSDADYVSITKSAYTGATALAKWNDDGRPTAAHIWQGFHYLSSVDRAFRGHYFNNIGKTRTTPQTFAPNNEGWMPAFSPTLADWDALDTWPLFPNFNIASSDSDGGMTWNLPNCSDGNYIWLLTPTPDDAGRIRKFDPVAKTWTATDNYYSFSGGYGGVLTDTSRMQMVYIEEDSNYLRVIDLVTGIGTRIICTGPAAAMFRPVDSSYMGACYDSKRDKYYVYAGQTQTGKSLYEIDPANSYSTRVIATTGTPGDTAAAGMCNRMKYLPELDTIVITPAANTPMWALALS